MKYDRKIIDEEVKRIISILPREDAETMYRIAVAYEREYQKKKGAKNGKTKEK